MLPRTSPLSPPVDQLLLPETQVVPSERFRTCTTSPWGLPTNIGYPDQRCPAPRVPLAEVRPDKSAQLWINYFRWPTPPPTSKKGRKLAPVKEEILIDISSDIDNALTGSKHRRQDVIDSEAGPSKKHKGKDRDLEVVGVRATLHPDAPVALELSIARTRVLDYL